MKLIVKNIKIHAGEEPSALLPQKLAKLGITEFSSIHILKRSLDARKAPDIYFIYSIVLETEEAISQSVLSSPDVSELEEFDYSSTVECGSITAQRPLIAGFGPCGIFCALLLARFGFRPVIIERGKDIDARSEDVDNFLKGGSFNASSNVGFGEGGAGTFSDGKLITRVKDKRIDFVLKEFIKHGAPEEILTDAHPHIGSDRLRQVIKSMRNEIISLGGKVLFSSTLTDIKRKDSGYTVEINGSENIFADHIFIATGHSATDTFNMLMKNSFEVVPKDFSIGVRIEHLQKDVDASLYKGAQKEPWGKYLPKGEYSISYREGERGVYSFCMCPGGLVIPSATEDGTIVTNGMSNFARDEKNANCALNVSVLKKDYGNTPQGAIDFLRALEKRAFSAGGSDFRAPCQTVGDFLEDTNKREFNNALPTYARGVKQTRLCEILPDFANDMLKKGLVNFSRRFSFFRDMSAPLTGLETRTSSPVRIVRLDNFMSVTHENIYPCGEGAGYAGGITSAAIDGLKAAEAFISNHKPQES